MARPENNHAAPGGPLPRFAAAAGGLFTRIRRSLITKLAIICGAALMFFFFLWSSLNMEAMEALSMANTVSDIDRLGTTIILGLHDSMLTYAPDATQEIVRNIGTQRAIKSIRVYNKRGEIKYSNLTSEIGTVTDIKQEACYVCHRVEPPLVRLDIRERTRVFTDDADRQCIGIIFPIGNDPSCSGDPCHVHSPGKKILGLLDMVVSLEAPQANLARFSRINFLMALAIAAAVFLILVLCLHLLVNRPVRKMMRATRAIAAGVGFEGLDLRQSDEMGELGRAIGAMGREVLIKQAELARQMKRYQDLFEHVPCTITVQDRDLRLISYNRQFADEFHARPGEYCYKVYKGLDAPCRNCPVIRTFEDGAPHATEEITTAKDGGTRSFFVSTAPMTDAAGNVNAVMEISLDITDSKFLEEELERSRRKYLAIFSCIPTALFVLDRASLTILECNATAEEVYGCRQSELIGRNFLDFFADRDRIGYERRIRGQTAIDRARHQKQNGEIIYVSVRVSTAAFPGNEVYLVSATDITRRLETEQQLIQASKMATLGEMATSVAHELNQPLTVIQTIADLLARKTRGDASPPRELFREMAEGIGKHIARATRIISHMREFGRKSEMKVEPVDLGEVLTRTLELFSQQLKVRNIEVTCDIVPDLPPVAAEGNRLEQVFMNLLLNARDAIEDHAAASPGADKRISLRVLADDDWVRAEIGDTGAGIAPEIQDKAFEPFFTTKAVGKGTGLGLSISYGIVKDYGGAIDIVSRPGQGARFVVRLPRHLGENGQSGRQLRD
ncbi:MAG: ATP-binding protein [Solidesulfovibrio sp.]|uniref:ATP-binding protein n=1 Tax=Solidesulfovibrio sp. TaxID=2910990 RepID=UPI002B1E999C|nr:ATP-binding protein [Solidesulfovibrio sp.]MEA4854887.1 PAS domain S-box protein [Solidesulfovibrio sp.]